MNPKTSVPAVRLALTFLVGTSLPLFAINPPPPVPGGTVLQSVAVGGRAPSPAVPCWQISGGKATFRWPGAPRGAIWFGPVPLCAGGATTGGGGGRGKGVSGAGQEEPPTPEPSPASGGGGRRNRACPGHVDCSSEGGGGPARPQSLRERAFFNIAPNQPGLGDGELTYYVDGLRANFGNPEILSFNSITNMEAYYSAPSATVSRYTIMQPDGTSITFTIANSKAPGQPYVTGMPSGESASSQAGISWTLPDGSFANKADPGARLSQFVPGYGWAHFSPAGGVATGYTTITGRQYSLPLAGMEIIRQIPGGNFVPNGERNSGILRQIKTPAGLFDIVPVTSGAFGNRSFEIREYAAPQVGIKPHPGRLFPVTGVPVFRISFSAPAGTSDQVTVVRALGTEKYTTDHTVTISGSTETWTQLHNNGPFRFFRKLVTSNFGSERISTWTTRLLQAPA